MAPANIFGSANKVSVDRKFTIVARSFILLDATTRFNHLVNGFPSHEFQDLLNPLRDFGLVNGLPSHEFQDLLNPFRDFGSVNGLPSQLFQLSLKPRTTPVEAGAGAGAGAGARPNENPDFLGAGAGAGAGFFPKMYSSVAEFEAVRATGAGWKAMTTATAARRRADRRRTFMVAGCNIVDVEGLIEERSEVLW